MPNGPLKARVLACFFSWTQTIVTATCCRNQPDAMLFSYYRAFDPNLDMSACMYIMWWIGEKMGKTWNQ
jgi:hypothetical protein